MKNKSIYAIIVAILVVATVIFAGGRASKPETLNIGVISSETGDFGAIGQAFSRGVQLAYDQHVQKNVDADVKIHIEDDGSESKKGLSAYNKLISLHKIDGLINLSSPTINIVYDSVTKSNLPVIQLGEQDRTPAKDTVYQVYPTQDAPEVAVGKFVKDRSNGNDTVLFYTNDTTVVKFVDNIKKGYEGSFVEEFKLDLNQKEYATIVAKAMAHKPKNIVISAYSTSGVRVLQEVLKYPERPTIIFDLIYDGTEYVKAFPKLQALEGVYVMTLKQSVDPVFVSAYKEKYGAEPSVFAAYGFDAFNTFIAGYDSDASDMSKNMKNLSLSGATGSITFNELGLRQPEFEMKVIKDGVLSAIQ